MTEDLVSAKKAKAYLAVFLLNISLFICVYFIIVLF